MVMFGFWFQKNIYFKHECVELAQIFFGAGKSESCHVNRFAGILLLVNLVVT